MKELSKLEKLRRKLFEKPCRNDMTFEEIEKLARAYGCEVRVGGRHSYHIVHRSTGTVIPIPVHGSTVGEAYVGELQKLFRKIETLEGK